MRLRSGELDLIEYLSGLCDRIEAENPKIHALLPDTFDRQRVLGQAKVLLARYPDPASRPPLFGTPVGIKDIFRVQGFPTRCGSSLPPRLFEGAEANSVSRLKRAGAVIMGKTVTTEFAWFEPGPTRNPHHLEHTPGGSSSGSAAGVAMGFFPIALGTQTAGSITRPAAFCGIVGFKPSFGRIPTFGIIPTSPSADHIGILCNDPTGIEILMPNLIPDWRPAKDSGRPRKMILAVPEGPYLEQATKNGREHFEGALNRLLQGGYEILRENPFPDIRSVNEDHLMMVAAEMARVHSSWFQEHRSLYRPKTVETIEKGLQVKDEELERVREGRLRLREDLEEQMKSKGIDFWICPSTPDHAPRGLESTGSPIMNIPWTYAGLPTLSLPSGMDRDGLPQGIQIVARYGEDQHLIASSKALFASLSAAP
ncbi:MAG: amidase [candidate division NC10 bacterium]|nr:amidase [candidate division NC10 bacterium]